MSNYFEIQDEIDRYITNHSEKTEEDIEWSLCDCPDIFDPISCDVHDYVKQDSLDEMQVRNEIYTRYYRANNNSKNQDVNQSSDSGVGVLFAIMTVIGASFALYENIHIILTIAYLILVVLIIIRHITMHEVDCSFSICALSVFVFGFSYFHPALSVIIMVLDYFFEIVVLFG